MRYDRGVKPVLINLYRNLFGGAADVLEVWSGPDYSFLVMRKDDGWVTTVSRADVDAYLSEDKTLREKGKASIIQAFHRFKQSENQEDHLA